jgi:hypothetical protein
MQADSLRARRRASLSSAAPLPLLAALLHLLVATMFAAQQVCGAYCKQPCTSETYVIGNAERTAPLPNLHTVAVPLSSNQATATATWLSCATCSGLRSAVPLTLLVQDLGCYAPAQYRQLTTAHNVRRKQTSALLCHLLAGAGPNSVSCTCQGASGLVGGLPSVPQGVVTSIPNIFNCNFSWCNTTQLDCLGQLSSLEVELAVTR